MMNLAICRSIHRAKPVPQTLALLHGPQSDVTGNRAGSSQTDAVNPIDLSANNGFFKEFGTIGRSCGTCHVEGLGWSITPEHSRKLRKDDALFRFDGSDCLSLLSARADSA